MGALLSTPDPVPEEFLVRYEAQAAALRIEKRKRTGHKPHAYVRREDRVRDLLEVLTRRQWPSVRPGWLLNPRTQKPMEIDCYCAALKCGVEVDGEQHYTYSSHMHKTRDAFVAQQERDHIKDRLCAHMDVTLIRVPPRSQLCDSQLAWFLTRELGRHDILKCAAC